MYPEKNKLTLPAALAVGLNAAIGAGIFSAPLALYLAAGPAGLTTYVLATLLILLIGLSFTTLIQQYQPRSFFFDLPQIWGGRTAGTITLLLYSVGLIVALGLLGKIAAPLITLSLGSKNPMLWGSILLLLTAISSQMGTRWLSWGQYILFGLTIIPMLTITLLSIRFGNYQNLTPFFAHHPLSIFQALPIVVFGFFGFEAVPALVSRITNPEKNSTRAIIGTIGITGITYFIFVSSIFYLLPTNSYHLPSLGAALISVIPQFSWLIATINWAIIITIAGTLYSMFPAITNLINQAQNIIPKKVIAGLVPIGAIIIMLVAQNLNVLFNLTAIGIAGAYGLTSWTLIYTRTTKQNLALGLLASTAALILCICALQGLW